MVTLQERYDDAMFAFSTGDYATAVAGLEGILAEDAEHFDARLALGMAYCRLGDFPRAIQEGHVAEKLRPQEQLVHTNLSLFYMRAGNKPAAEHHGLQARIASWRGNMTPPGQKPDSPDELALAPEPPAAGKPPTKFPDMPWKKKA